MDGSASVVRDKHKQTGRCSRSVNQVDVRIDVEYDGRGLHIGVPNVFDVPTKEILLDNPEVEIIVETYCRSWGKLLI